jgi:pimeloyl-ACP methyl ester carboxylesterase
MVGHSLGVYESLRFADRHADQVVGMVLVDPSIPNQAQRMKAVAPKLSIAVKKFYVQYASQFKTCATKIENSTLTLTSADPDGCFSYDPEYPPDLKNSMRQLDSKPARWVTKASLLAQFDTSSIEVINKSRNFGSMPLRILTAADPEEMPPTIGSAAIAQYPTFLAEFLHGHDALAALSTNGNNTVVHGTSHYIQLIKPDVVISTISQMVDEIQLKTKLATKQN